MSDMYGQVSKLPDLWVFGDEKSNVLDPDLLLANMIADGIGNRRLLLYPLREEWAAGYQARLVGNLEGALTIGENAFGLVVSDIVVAGEMDGPCTCHPRAASGLAGAAADRLQSCYSRGQRRVHCHAQAIQARRVEPYRLPKAASWNEYSAAAHARAERPI